METHVISKSMLEEYLELLKKHNVAEFSMCGMTVKFGVKTEVVKETVKEPMTDGEKIEWAERVVKAQEKLLFHSAL